MRGTLTGRIRTRHFLPWRTHVAVMVAAPTASAASSWAGYEVVRIRPKLFERRGHAATGRGSRGGELLDFAAGERLGAVPPALNSPDHSSPLPDRVRIARRRSGWGLR